MNPSVNHREELFFLDNFDLDRVFNTINRADYLVLYSIKVQQEADPVCRVYLADLAATLHLRIPQMSRTIEKLQDKGFVAWKTDNEAGRTYVELTSKAVELMAEERAWMQSCYARIREEIGEEELMRTARTMHRITEILRGARENGAPAEESLQKRG